MEKKGLPCWMVLAIIATIVLAALAVRRCLINPSELPAWVQAVGSVAAIFAAIWVAHLHHNNNIRLHQLQEKSRAAEIKNAEKTEVGRILQALVDEVSVRIAQFEIVLGEKLDACSSMSEPYFNYYSNMPTNPFPVYQALLPRLPLIEDIAVRQKIVRCYAVLEALVLTIETNSMFARSLQAAQTEAIANTTKTSVAMEATTKRRLILYFPQLQRMASEARKEAKELLDLIALKQAEQ